MQSFKYVGTEITWAGEGVEEYGHVKDDPENVVVRVDPRYFRPTEVELLLVSVFEVCSCHNLIIVNLVYFFFLILSLMVIFLPVCMNT